MLQYDVCGTFVQEWESIEAASSVLNITKSTIRHCCNGNQKLAGNYIWKYKIEQFKLIKPVNIEDYEEVFATETGCIIGKSGYPNYGSNLDGYLTVSIKCKSDGKYYRKLVHRLVALAF